LVYDHPPAAVTRRTESRILRPAASGRLRSGPPGAPERPARFLDPSKQKRPLSRATPRLGKGALRTGRV